MGAARSGSTVLGILLGNGDGAFYAGELDLYARTGGRPTNDAPEIQAFWARVREKLKSGEVTTDPNWHVGFEHPRGLVLRRARGARAAYRRFAAALYEAIAVEAGARVVIDSSHYPLRLFHLRRLPALQIYALHLVRDPRAVVAS